ncbi:MerR family transcriptional regulator [Fulvimarina pelagi]|nr:MerR family transcriptional regulator [Fulvimarina pelagi]
MDVRLARKSGLRKIGEVAAMFQTTPRTLLYYEEQGILNPIKTAKGTRMYGEADLQRFATAHELAALGVSLRTIRDLATVARENTDPDMVLRKQSALLARLAEKLRSRIDRIERITTDIDVVRRLISDTCLEPAEVETEDAEFQTEYPPSVEELSGVSPQILSLLRERDHEGSALPQADQLSEYEAGPDYVRSFMRMR